MSFQWVPYADLIGPKWNFTPLEVFGFITKGLLTPHDENEKSLLPEKFLVAQQKADTLAEFVESENHWKGKLDSLTVQFNTAWDSALAGLDKEDQKSVLDALAEPEEDSKPELDALGDLDALTIRYNSMMSLRKKNPISYALSKFGEDRRLELEALILRISSVQGLRAVNRGKMEEARESERFLTEHSNHPWQAISFTPREYETESARIAAAFFRETEVALLRLSLLAAKDHGGEPKPIIGFQAAQADNSLRIESWKDISIFMISDSACRVETPSGKKLYTFAELGMSDKRKGDRPSQLWELMQLFATTGGCITGIVMGGYNRQGGRKFDFLSVTKRLNKHLQALFGIEDSIFERTYKQAREYRTKIKFYDRRDMSPLK